MTDQLVVHSYAEQPKHRILAFSLSRGQGTAIWWSGIIGAKMLLFLYNWISSLNRRAIDGMAK